MTVTVNDQAVEVEEGTTVAALLHRLGLPDKGVAVALNAAVLPRSQWHGPVPDGAVVDVVTAVQGG